MMFFEDELDTADELLLLSALCEKTKCLLKNLIGMFEFCIFLFQFPDTLLYRICRHPLMTTATI